MKLIQKNNVEAVRSLLLKNEWSVDDPCVAPRFAKPRIVDSEALRSLSYSVALEKKEMVKLFLAFGADVNAQNDDGLTALMAAVAVKNEDILDLLLSEPHIDPTARDRRGWDVCSYFEFYGAPEWKARVPHCLQRASAEA